MVIKRTRHSRAIYTLASGMGSPRNGLTINGGPKISFLEPLEVGKGVLPTFVLALVIIPTRCFAHQLWYFSRVCEPTSLHGNPNWTPIACKKRATFCYVAAMKSRILRQPYCPVQCTSTSLPRSSSHSSTTTTATTATNLSLMRVEMRLSHSLIPWFTSFAKKTQGTDVRIKAKYSISQSPVATLPPYSALSLHKFNPILE